MCRRRSLGFTLTEVIVVLAIVGILAAITLPVFARAREQAAKTACLSNLRQLYLAVELYRGSGEKGNNYGTPDEMGLPPDLVALQLRATPLLCRGRDPRTCTGGASYEHRWPPLQGFPFYDALRSKAWSDYVEKYGESSVIISDPNHQQECPIGSYYQVRVIGVTLGGAVTTRIRRGNYMTTGWWHDD